MKAFGASGSDMKHWSQDQLGDFPYRRRTDRRPHKLAIVSGLFLLTMAVYGVLHLVGAL